MQYVVIHFCPRPAIIRHRCSRTTQCMCTNRSYTNLHLHQKRKSRGECFKKVSSGANKWRTISSHITIWGLCQYKINPTYNAKPEWFWRHWRNWIQVICMNSPYIDWTCEIIHKLHCLKYIGSIVLHAGVGFQKTVLYLSNFYHLIFLPCTDILAFSFAALATLEKPILTSDRHVHKTRNKEENIIKQEITNPCLHLQAYLWFSLFVCVGWRTSR